MGDDPERGLYHKYNVERTDGQLVGDCFVLEFKDPNTWPALRSYAATVRPEYPVLALDIEARVAFFEQQHGHDNLVVAGWDAEDEDERGIPQPRSNG